MALLPTGSDRLLEIRTTYVDVVIKSKGRQPLTHLAVGTGTSSLKVVGINIEQISLPLQGLTEKYSDYEGVSFHECSVEPLFFEQTDYALTIRAKNGEKIDFRSNSSLIEERIGRVIDDDSTLLSGIINFGNNV